MIQSQKLQLIIADIDECNEDDNSCQDGGICRNYVGGYGCYCTSRNKFGVKLVLIIGIKLSMDY